MKESKVPQQAIEFMNQINFNKRIKWFAEESQDGKTFEAKVYYKGKKHSIEFSSKGEIIDIEVKVKFSQIAKTIQENIKSVLKEKFKKFKIRKVQLQYKGSEELLRENIMNKFSIAPRYEIVIKGKSDKNFELFEILFDSTGQHIEKELKFSPDNFDNLQF
ncbi:hypothetical protein ACOSP6_13115 [Tenacibaculum sp. MEBiC06402]|uniref:hypothetical protein n=1 Tax=unclassified Tenacibaculum TaxID=2635139 RepID=UPI003B9D09A2